MQIENDQDFELVKDDIVSTRGQYLSQKYWYIAYKHMTMILQVLFCAIVLPVHQIFHLLSSFYLRSG